MFLGETSVSYVFSMPTFRLKRFNRIIIWPGSGPHHRKSYTCKVATSASCPPPLVVHCHFIYLFIYN